MPNILRGGPDQQDKHPVCHGHLAQAASIIKADVQNSASLNRWPSRSLVYPLDWFGRRKLVFFPNTGVQEKPVRVHDLHATVLHLFGLDHTRLTYRVQGRDFRLTDAAVTR